jgi:hypothetical protein
MATAVEVYLEDKKPVGTTITIEPPTYVPTFITLDIKVKTSYNVVNVAREIRSAFINPGGLFSYEKATFGGTVSYASVIAKAYGIAAVTDGGSVTVTKFNKISAVDNTISTAGIPLANGEIATLPTENLIINVTFLS